MPERGVNELDATAARVARLRSAICDCPNKVGRHACDVFAEQASEAIEELKRRQTVDHVEHRHVRPHWARIVKAIVKELSAKPNLGGDAGV